VYIEFGPVGYAGVIRIKAAIEEWATRYQVRYTQKTYKNTHRLGFNDESNFALFSLTWNPDLSKEPWLRYRLVNYGNSSY